LKTKKTETYVTAPNGAQKGPRTLDLSANERTSPRRTRNQKNRQKERQTVRRQPTRRGKNTNRGVHTRKRCPEATERDPEELQKTDHSDLQDDEIQNDPVYKRAPDTDQRHDTSTSRSERQDQRHDLILNQRHNQVNSKSKIFLN